MPDAAPLRTGRLLLEVLRPDAMTALVDDDRPRADRLQGRTLTDEFVDTLGAPFLRMQLERMAAVADGPVWGPRAIVLADGGTVVGHCGFHGPPAVVGRAEVGYTVLTPFRRRGVAVEAVGALVDLARGLGVPTLFASTLPDNVASQAVLRRLGFVPSGTERDGDDGHEELLFSRDL